MEEKVRQNFAMMSISKNIKLSLHIIKSKKKNEETQSKQISLKPFDP